MRTRNAIRARLVVGLMLTGLPGLLENLQAQTPVNYIGWYSYDGYHPFTQGRPWALSVQADIKRDDLITKESALAGRFGLSYDVSSRFRLSGGYVIQYNYPYDSASQPYNWTGHGIWEQFQWNHRFGTRKRYTLNQRFRTEQRWLERKDDDRTRWLFENSVRYQLKLSVAMNPTVSLTFYDELQLRVPAAGKRVFDQNIIFAGFNFNLDKKKRWKLEVGVLNQSYWNSQETMSGRKRINHTLRMGVTFNAPFHTH